MTFDRTIKLDVIGMVCERCVSHVAEELRALLDVANISVTLAKGGTSEALVCMNANTPDATLEKVIDETGGYEIGSIVH